MTSSSTSSSRTSQSRTTATTSGFSDLEAAAEVTLVPWDPESSEHIKRLYDQRVAAGWKQDMVEKWVGLQQEGKMTIRWVVLSDTYPEAKNKLAQHIACYPDQNTPLTDSAISFGGKLRHLRPRTKPSASKSCEPFSFIPIGHISIDTENTLDAELADVSRGIYCITTFYISGAIQFGGLGRAAMDAIETAAAGPPCYAKMLTLNTLENAHYLDLALWKAMGKAIPPLSNQDWYERRGYEIFKRVEKASRFRDREGNDWWFNDVLMRKTIV